MRIAYVVTAHKLPEQLVRMVRRLHTERSSFFIHVDKKTPDDIYEKMQSGLRGVHNVFFVKRHSSYWGEPSLLNAALEGVRGLFASGVAFDRVVFTSGQCYPLCSSEQIEAFFEAHAGEQFIDWHDYREVPPDGGWKESGPARVNNWHFRLGKMNFVIPGRLEHNSINRYCRSRYKWMPAVSAIWAAAMKLVPIKRKHPRGLQPFFYGSQFCCITREFACYIHRLLDTNHPHFRFFQSVDIADEMFFQNIVMSSPFKDQVVNDNLFCIDWKNPNPQVPRTWLSEDFERLVESGKLFARKFDVTRDAVVLDRLDERATAADASLIKPSAADVWRVGQVQGV